MVNLIATWIALRNDRRAVSALEYSLILSMAAGSILIAIGRLAGAISGSFSSVGQGL
jgi:Flp pilus assembly pilin Flp